MKPNILACPRCQSKQLFAWVHSGNVPSVGEVRDWAITCKGCRFELNYLSRDGSEASAIRDWNNAVKEFHILNYLNQNQCLAFDNGTNIDKFIEDCNFTQRQLSMSLSALAKIYLLEKSEFKACDIDGMKDGKKYNTYMITEHGKERLKRLNRENKIACN